MYNCDINKDFNLVSLSLFFLFYSLSHARTQCAETLTPLSPSGHRRARSLSVSPQLISKILGTSLPRMRCAVASRSAFTRALFQQEQRKER